MNDEIPEPTPEVTEEKEETSSRKQKDKILTLRLSGEEWDKIQVLKKRPHYINMSNYLRDCLMHLYDSKTKPKAGRVADDIKPSTGA